MKNKNVIEIIEFKIVHMVCYQNISLGKWKKNIQINIKNVTEL